MAADRKVIRHFIVPQLRADASGDYASARPHAPGRAGANPAGNGFPIAGRLAPPLLASSEISMSSAAAVTVAKLCRLAA